MALRRLGRWDESVEIFVNATRLDPADRHYHAEALETMFYGRQLERAKRVADNLGERFPDDPGVAAARSFVYLYAFGDIEAAQAAVEPAMDDESIQIQFAMIDIPLIARDYARAIENATNSLPFFDKFLPGAGNLNIATAFRFQGSVEQAHDNLLKANESLETSIEENSSRLEEGNLAYTYAMLGAAKVWLEQNEDASANCQKARSLLPETKDALDGTAVSCLCAWVQAQSGDVDGALDEIARLVVTPAGLYKAELVLHPRWDFLRDNPRFQQIIANAEK